MAGSVSRRNLFRIGGGVAAAGFGASLPSAAHAQGPEPAVIWHSKLVYPGADGELNYALDTASGKKIPNFSWAGYRNGEVPIPDVPTVKTIAPLPGGEDNTAHINAALREVGEMPTDANGIRGALQLEAGVYKVAGTVLVRYSGVVLRGMGRTGDPAVSTIIRSTATAGIESADGVECPLRIGTENREVDWGKPPAVTIPVVANVPANSRRLKLASTTDLAVGDNIVIWHPCTAEWIAAVDHGGVDLDPPWTVGSLPIMYNRYIRAIQGDEIVICAPVYNDLDISLSEVFVYKWSDDRQVRNAGVENLRVDMVEPVGDVENHPDSCIVIERTQDTWIKKVSTLHFKRSGVMVRHSTRVTVDDAWAREPRSDLVGGRRYNFCAGYMAQQVLFKNVWASQARHAFVSGGGAATSGIVWLDSRSNNGYLESGGHAHWSQGLLFDNVTEEMNSSPEHKKVVLNLHNRVDGGNGADAHGWSSVYSVLWNCKLDNGNRACVQRPPTTQNFAIGTTGDVADVVTGTNWLGTEERGYVEDKAGTLEPVSLYRKQLADRLNTP